MTTKEVADKFIAMLKEGKYVEARAEFFTDETESIEPAGADMQYVKGLAAIEEKGRMFQENVEEMHSGFVGEPIVAGKYFSVAMGMDVTMKQFGRMNLEEICMYEVKEGKIIKEAFFF